MGRSSAAWSQLGGVVGPRRPKAQGDGGVGEQLQLACHAAGQVRGG
ncbi:hypothetical protein [Kribbella sp. DT2]